VGSACSQSYSRASLVSALSNLRIMFAIWSAIWQGRCGELTYSSLYYVNSSTVKCGASSKQRKGGCSSAVLSYFWKYIAFLLWLSWESELPRNVAVDAGFLYNKASMLGAATKYRSCSFACHSARDKLMPLVSRKSRVNRITKEVMVQQINTKLQFHMLLVSDSENRTVCTSSSL
jgi:hypothetical protein